MTLLTRVIPVLLLDDGGLVKTHRFKKPKYIGDPINAIRIFNDKEADEIVFLDISKDRYYREPDYELLAEIVSEAFMPFAYGGGLQRLDQIEKIYHLGVEKVVINSKAAHDPEFIKSASSIAGSSGVAVSMDVKSTWLGGKVLFVDNGKKKINLSPLDYAKLMEEKGAGELIVGSVDLDGTMKGYDLKLIEQIANAVEIPVVPVGGARSLADFRTVVDVGASAAAAGSMFVFHGRQKGILITYPSSSELIELFK